MDGENPTNPAGPAPEGNPAPAAGNTGGAGDTLDLTISRGEYEALLSARREADQLRAQQTQATRSVEERVGAIESRYRAAASAGAIEAVLGSLGQFTSEQARADARALLAADVQVREAPDGTAEVVHRGIGQPLGQVDPAVLRRRFAHLMLPENRGGSGAAAAIPNPDGGYPRRPATAGEALIELALQRQGGPRGHPMLGDDLK